MLIPVGKGCPSVVHLDSGRCPFLKTGKDYLIRRIRMTPYKVSSDVGDIDYAFYAETDNIMYVFLRFFTLSLSISLSIWTSVTKLV